MKPILTRVTYLPNYIGTTENNINTVEILAHILGMESLPHTHPRVYIQDSKTARNLYMYIRDGCHETTPRQHIRNNIAPVRKSLALRMSQ